MWTQEDYKDNFEHVDDNNGDGLSDYPDFEIDNSYVGPDIEIEYD